MTDQDSYDNPIPDTRLRAAELNATLRADLDPAAADWVTAALVADWTAGTTPYQGAVDRHVDRGAWAAVRLTYRAARLRQQGRHDVADALTRCAEVAVLMWADVVAVRALVVDLDQLPDAPEQPVAR